MDVITVKDHIVATLGIETLERTRRDKIAEDLVMLATERTFDDLLENMSSADLDRLQNFADLQKESIPSMLRETDKHLQQFSLIFNKHLNELLRSARQAA